MVTVKVILMIAALLLEAFAALGSTWPAPEPRQRLIAAGLAAWLASIVLPV